MVSVLVAADVDLPETWPGGYAPDVAALPGSGTVRRCLPVPGRHRVSVPAGSELWLLQRGSGRRGPRGLIGHGTAAAGLRTDAPSGLSLLEVDFDLLLPLGEQLPVPLLTGELPDLPWHGRTALASVPPAALPSLRRLWSGFIGPQEDPLVPTPGTLAAPALHRQQVNRYEQDPDARRQCLAFHGDVCAACGLVPGRRYGAAGDGILQVHHLFPAPELEEGYLLDPVADLVPLCPTCHTVAHTRVPAPYSPAEVRALLAGGDGGHDGDAVGPGPGTGHVTGQLVTARQQQAREDADRLRGFR